MMSAPVPRTLSGFIAFTVAAVPTGMKAGVRISPRCIWIVPVRALPSVAWSVKEKRGGVMLFAPLAPPPGAVTLPRPRAKKAGAAWGDAAPAGL